MTVTGVEGKAKLSQNRSLADQRGVIDGLRADATDGRLDEPAAPQAHAIATLMTHHLPARDESDPADPEN